MNVELVNEVEALELEVIGVQKAAMMEIMDQDDYTQATNELKEIKARIKYAKDFFEPTIQAAHKAHKEAVSAMKRIVEPMEKAERELKTKATAFMNRLEAEKRERERLELESRKRQEEFLRENGLLAENESAPAPPVKPEETLDKNGVSFVETWKFEITDPALIPREFLLVDEKKIGGVVRAMKDQTSIPGVRAYAEKTARVR